MLGAERAARQLAFPTRYCLLTNSPEYIPRHKLEPLWGWSVAPNAANNCFWPQSLDIQSRHRQEKDSKLKSLTAFFSFLSLPLGKWNVKSPAQTFHILSVTSVVLVTGSQSVVWTYLALGFPVLGLFGMCQVVGFSQSSTLETYLLFFNCPSSFPVS